MKPLLIIPPAPPHWPAIEALRTDIGPTAKADLQVRLAEGLPEARDAFAIIPDGAHARACAALRRRGDIGVISDLFTDPAHRRKGHARALMQTLLSWFDMTGGKWLYATVTDGPAEPLFEKFGFRRNHICPTDAEHRATLLRGHLRQNQHPFERLAGKLTIRPLIRADWPLLVALQQHRSGPDPRVPSNESAISAERANLELLAEQDHGVCALMGALCGDTLIAVGSVALKTAGARTYAMLFPPTSAPAALRRAIIDLARERGYEQVDFPMEALLDEKSVDRAHDESSPVSSGSAESQTATPTQPVEEPPAQ